MDNFVKHINPLSKPVVYTAEALWANIDNWEAFKSKNMRSDSFAKVIDYIEKTIKNQQTIGVITGMYDTAVKKSYFV